MDENILLVGCGYWGKNWYKTLLKKGCKFSVVEPNTSGPVDENKIRIYQSVDEVFLKDFTHAIVATPASTHVSVFEQLTAYLTPGRILIEKPCGTSFQSARHLNGCYPGYLQLQSPAYKYISGNLSEIGTPFLYKSTRASMGPRVRRDCTIIEDYLVHDLYLFLDLFKPNYAISVRQNDLTSNLHYSQEDTISLRLINRNARVVGDMFSSWWYPIKERRVIIVGTKGSFIWIGDELFINRSHYTKGDGKDAFGNDGDHLVVSAEEKISLQTTTTLELELEDFLSKTDAYNKESLLSTVWKLMYELNPRSQFNYPL